MRWKSTINSPAAIPDLVAWYDAFDFASITQSSGLVSQWNDKSGNGYNVSQATSGNRPSYSATGLNSRPAITFATKVLAYAASNVVGQNVTGMSLFGVLSTTDRTQIQRYAVALNNSTAQRCSLSILDPNTGASGDYSGGVRRQDADTFAGLRAGTITNNTPFIHALTYNFPTTSIAMYSSGASLASSSSFSTSGSSSNTASTGLYLGAVNAAIGQPLLGAISEVIFYNRALSVAEQRRVEWYLARKWALNVV